jgi:HPt (histidine-containing phosphotransfer) domain-containing protein
MSADQMPAIDVLVLDELEHSIGDDREFLRELVETYLDDAPVQLATMRSGMTTGDVAGVNRAAHTLKSNSASVGAMTLSEMSRELEALTQPDVMDASGLGEPEILRRVNATAAELERAMRELDALVPAGSK